MGQTDHFVEINTLLSAKLGYHLHPGKSDAFRGRIVQLGVRRMTKAIELTAAEPATDVQERHCILEAIMWHMIRDIGPKHTLRNPQAHAARQLMRDMDARVMELVGDSRQ